IQEWNDRQHGGTVVSTACLYEFSRLEFAAAHMDKPNAFWRMFYLTIKPKIELFGHNEKRYIWRSQGKNTSIMLPGCFAASGIEDGGKGKESSG
uniref:Uncharacterized protein n=1 Tax=Amphilophus citrinellus TaxID=61819 RepID=A0A3Q0S5A0_AMPCI